MGTSALDAGIDVPVGMRGGEGFVRKSLNKMVLVTQRYDKQRMASRLLHGGDCSYTDNMQCIKAQSAEHLATCLRAHGIFGWLCKVAVVHSDSLTVLPAPQQSSFGWF